MNTPSLLMRYVIYGCVLRKPANILHFIATSNKKGSNLQNFAILNIIFIELLVDSEFRSSSFWFLAITLDACPSDVLTYYACVKIVVYILASRTRRVVHDCSHVSLDSLPCLSGKNKFHIETPFGRRDLLPCVLARNIFSWSFDCRCRTCIWKVYRLENKNGINVWITTWSFF